MQGKLNQQLENCPKKNSHSYDGLDTEFQNFTLFL